MVLGPVSLAEIPSSETWSTALVEGHAPAQVGESEGCSPITSISCAEKGEQGAICADGEELTITEGPAPRCEVAAEHCDFTDEWICCHGLI